MGQSISRLRPSILPDVTRNSISNTINEEGEDLEDYLDDEMIIPTIYSDLDLPLIDSSMKNEDVLESAKVNGYNYSKLNSSSLDNENDDEWETIETTITYGNGTTHCFIDKNSLQLRETENKENSSENRWTTIIKVLLKICGSKASVEGEEMFGNLTVLFDNIDHVSSRAFPLTFLFINIMYWIFYVYVL